MANMDENTPDSNLPAKVSPVKRRLTKDEKKALRLALAKKAKTAEDIHKHIPSISIRMARLILDDPHWVETLHKKQVRRTKVKYDQIVPSKLLAIADRSQDGKEVAAVSKELRSYMEIGTEATLLKEKSKKDKGPVFQFFQKIIQGSPTKVVEDISDKPFPGIDD